MEFGFAEAETVATGAAAKSLVMIEAQGVEDGTVKNSSSSSPSPAVTSVRGHALTLGTKNSDAPFPLAPSGASVRSTLSVDRQSVAAAPGPAASLLSLK